MTRFAQALGNLWAWLASFFQKKRHGDLFTAEFVDDFPEKAKSNRVYIAGEQPHLWGAALFCPCGCGDFIELNLLPQARPSWEAEVHEDNTVTLDPSIWRTKGCGSHFFVRHGRIEWC